MLGILSEKTNFFRVVNTVEEIKSKIEEVLKTEKDAEKIIQNARSECEQIRRKAESESDSLMESALSEAQKIIQDEQKQSESEIDSLIKDLEQKTQDNMKSLEKSASGKVEQAINRVVELLV